MNVASRVPGFGDLSLEDQILYLKESFVEDYRIGLNRREKNGKFILPSTVCFIGDFQKPELLRKGVEIVERIVRHQRTDRAKRKSASEANEINRIAMASAMHERFLRNPNWVPGIPSITEEQIQKAIADLQAKDAYRQTAAASESR